MSDNLLTTMAILTTTCRQTLCHRWLRFIHDQILTIYHKATRPTQVRTRPALHEAKDEAEAKYYEAETEAEAKKFSVEAVLASRT